MTDDIATEHLNYHNNVVGSDEDDNKIQSYTEAIMTEKEVAGSGINDDDDD